jgi:IS30 family transposase
MTVHDRPATADDRTVPGHWEGDLIMGAHNRTAIGTLVERSTRYLVLVHLPQGRKAATPHTFATGSSPCSRPSRQG